MFSRVDILGLYVSDRRTLQDEKLLYKRKRANIRPDKNLAVPCKTKYNEKRLNQAHSSALDFYEEIINSFYEEIIHSAFGPINYHRTEIWSS